MGLTFKITLNETYADHFEAVSSEWGIPIEQAILLTLALSIGDKKMLNLFSVI